MISAFLPWKAIQMRIETDLGDLDPYKIRSRREIIGLLRALRESNQFVRMIFSDGSESVVTSVIEVHEAANLVLIDCARTNLQNQRIEESKNVSFESVLDRIRIFFSTDDLQLCEYDGRPAFCFAIPVSVIRLQRRQYYRVVTPRCHLQIPSESASMTVSVMIRNISASGLGIIDDKRLIDDTPGRVYEKCRLLLPGFAPIEVNLQMRNSEEIPGVGDKTMRRIGCLFVNADAVQIASVQRYITKLEREQNAKATGLR